MAAVAPGTGYYLNRELAIVALIVQGVRFPAGTWIHIADQGKLAVVEGLIGHRFPELKGKVLTLFSLTRENDVQAFELRSSQATAHVRKMDSNFGPAFPLYGSGILPLSR